LKESAELKRKRPSPSEHPAGERLVSGGGAGEQSFAFRIETAITREDRHIDRLRTMDEVRQRQLLTT
jgi:hypothetical protein